MSSSLETGTVTASAGTRPRWHKPLAWCAGVLLALVAVVVLAGAVLARRLQPMMRARLLATFAERFNSPASLDDLQVHYNGQLQVDGRGLRVQSVLTGVPGDPAHPMLQVQEFHFHLGLLTALSRSPRIHHVRIRGVQLSLPPIAAAQSHQPEPKHQVNLEYAEVDDVHIHFQSSAPDRAPMIFDLPHLAFHGVSRSAPIHFHAVIDNGPPLALTESDGTIGPWNFDDPRLTPLQGNFAFHDKDVSSVRGLRGRLSLDGQYQGTVGNMQAQGTTDDQGFALDVSSHPVHLRTKFVIALQAAQSTVLLEHLDGTFEKSAFACSGVAIKDHAANAFRLDVQLKAPAARTEDALTLGTRTSPPAMRGTLSVAGQLQMRAGAESVSRKLTLEHAAFTVTDGTFGNAAMQQSFDELVERAQGDPKDATERRSAHAAMNIRGTLHLHDDVLHIREAHVTAPGTQATLHGTYSLAATTFQFDGNVQTAAKLSHMTRGIKSLLLKPLNRLFAHGNGTGATLPVHIQGQGNVAHVSTRIADISVKAPGMQ